MSRIRRVKPDYTKSEKIADLSIEIRYFFLVLWTRCDLNGVFPWRARWLKAELFPYDDRITSDVIEAWLAALVVNRNVDPFEDAGKKWGAVHGWRKHQWPQPNEREWHAKVKLAGGETYPEPPAMGGDSADAESGCDESERENDDNPAESTVDAVAIHDGYPGVSTKHKEEGVRRKEEGGRKGHADVAKNPPPSSFKGGGMGQGQGERLRRVLAAAGFGANNIDLDEFRILLGKRAQCRTWPEVESFLTWAKRVASNQGVNVRHSRQCELLADQWNEYGRRDNFAAERLTDATAKAVTA